MSDSEASPYTELSTSWFEWHFEQALLRAVDEHGIEAAGFAWTASQHLKRGLPSGVVRLYTEDAIQLPSEISTRSVA